MLVRFKDEHELRRIVSRCHSILWERQGLDPAQAFDEFSKLLSIRLFDEVNGGSRTTIHRRETPSAFAARIRALFAESNASRRFKNVFKGEAIVADALSIYHVFRELAPYSVVATTAEVDGADVKGTIYEQMIGATFRGQLGQFFTPRTIVEFMVRMVGIEEDKTVYDPACGSGGFLVMCAKVIREQLRGECGNGRSGAAITQRTREYSRRRLYGTEINERTVRVARLNFLLHGLDYRNVRQANALRIERRGLGGEVKRTGVDFVFANPPFAGVEKDAKVLSRYALGRGSDRTVSAVTREVLFIERIVRTLRKGGEAGIVVPQGIFTNRSLGRVRDYLRENTRILAVVELPEWAFAPSGTNVRGSLLFIRKEVTGKTDYPVFVKKVEHIGFTSTGRPVRENELPETIREYASGDERYLVPIAEMQSRIDAKFFIPENQRTIRLFRRNPCHKLLRLAEIGTFEREKVNLRGVHAEIALIETSAVDPFTLAITPKYVKGAECNYTSARRVHGGDILISRRRTYRGAIVVVPAELDGALAISEFSVLRLHKGYDAGYVVEILRSSEFLKLMTIYSTGEMSGRLGERDLETLAIPVPTNHVQIARTLRTHRERILDLESQVASEREDIERKCRAVIMGEPAHR